MLNKSFLLMLLLTLASCSGVAINLQRGIASADKDSIYASVNLDKDFNSKLVGVDKKKNKKAWQLDDFKSSSCRAYAYTSLSATSVSFLAGTELQGTMQFAETEDNSGGTHITQAVFSADKENNSEKILVEITCDFKADETVEPIELFNQSASPDATAFPM